MKYIRQFLIILFVSFLGEILRYLIPLPVPASVYGMILMFAALETGILKLSAVKETGKFLVEIMALMFIPAGVGLMSGWSALKPVLVPVIVIVLVSTVAVMAVSGKVTQFVIRAERNGNSDEGTSE